MQTHAPQPTPPATPDSLEVEDPLAELFFSWVDKDDTPLLALSYHEATLVARFVRAYAGPLSARAVIETWLDHNGGPGSYDEPNARSWLALTEWD